MAQVDYFLKLSFTNAGDANGESTASGHEQEIQINSYSLGVVNAGTFGAGGGGGAGKASYQDVHFTMTKNIAAPLLHLACATGDHMVKATLCLRKAGGSQEDFDKIEFEKGFVTSYQEGGSSGDLIPTVQFSLNFDKIVDDYKSQNDDGTIGSGPGPMGFDLGTEQKV